MSKARILAAPPPQVIDDTNLSRAWARLLLQVLDNAGTEVAPLILSLSGFAENAATVEDPAVRQALDRLLELKDRIVVEKVAFTIFPQRLWEISRGDRNHLFALYCKTFPRWQAMNRRANGRGMYFERMVMYGRGPCDGNQLEWILSQFNSPKSVRRSMLQATTFDPGRDHVTSAQLGFPCLQQVSFEPTAAGLVTNAFYATQQIFDKAYGNYLGLGPVHTNYANRVIILGWRSRKPNTLALPRTFRCNAATSACRTCRCSTPSCTWRSMAANGAACPVTSAIGTPFTCA